MQIVTDCFQKEIKEHGKDSFPFLVCHEKLSRYESGSFLWHWHPEIELTLVTEGRMIYKVNDQTFNLCKGQALFGNSSTLHSGFMYQNQDCAYTSITFDPRLIYGHETSALYLKYVKPILQNHTISAVCFDHSAPWHQEVFSILSALIRIESENTDAWELDILIELEKFWRLLFLNCAHNGENASVDRKNYDRIRTMITFVEENYGQKMTLEDIAGTIHICKSECSRMFKKHMNISLFEFILQYRIEKSLEYLVHTSRSVNEIAEAVGFNDSNYFSKVFHKYKGCSPTEYRKNVQESPVFRLGSGSKSNLQEHIKRSIAKNAL